VPSPTSDQVHVPTAIGKGKQKMAGKARLDGDETEMGKKLGKIPPQFLPKKKGGKPTKGAKMGGKAK